MSVIKIWTFIVVLCVLGNAEAYTQAAFDEIKPSVNAQQFISAGSSNSGLHTGQISVNIPLFTLQGKGVDVPISISYNGVGITHASEASCIGLGWSLLSGGVITQTIRDKNDLGYAERKPWHYNGNYLQSKQIEQNNNPYTNNLFDLAMEQVIMDGEPDIFSYSFLGYSGDICLEYNADGSRSWTMYPDKSFRMEKTTNGFCVTTNKGIKCLFEEIEKKQSENVFSSTSWFLTRVETPEGGVMTFIYSDDRSMDPTDLENHSAYLSKRITRINYDYGYVNFISAGRSDKYYSLDANKKSQRITNLELFNTKGELIKGYQLDNNAYFSNSNASSNPWENTRLKLGGIREYNNHGEFLPYYRFEYDHFFSLPKTSMLPSNPFPLPKGTWAHNPASVTSIDRDHYGVPKPRRYCYDYTPDGSCMWALEGFHSAVDPMDGYSLSDYLCLTKIDYPTGGSETYYYENHDYGFYCNSSTNLPPFTNQKISGKRIWKKETSNNKGNLQTFFYKYRMHDHDYQLTSASSGVLVNPSIHTTTQYSLGGTESERWLVSSPFQTLSPQNSMSGSPVHYTEIEETQNAEFGNVHGKKIFYFESMQALPAVNYIYLNYGLFGGSDNLLINLPNTLYGKQNYNIPELVGLSTTNFTYLAYPLGRFNISHLNEGKLLKEVILNSSGEVVRKTENQYTAGNGIDKTQFGLLVKNFTDGDNKKRYLIAQTQLQFGVKELVKQTTTHYFQNDSITEEQSTTYTNLNLIQSSSSTLGIGKYLVKEYVYPSDVVFQTTVNLSTQAASIKTMKDLNMIGVPLQITLKNGDEYIEGVYNTFKQLPNGAIVSDTVFHLEARTGASVARPFVNTSGLIVKNTGFAPEKIFSTYDNNGNPTTAVGKDGVKETIVWGHGGKYPIARIVNYTDNQLRNNSTVLNQLTILENFTEITEFERTSLSTCNQIIRNNMPGNVKVSTYTYSPIIGMTSATDETGITT